MFAGKVSVATLMTGNITGATRLAGKVSLAAQCWQARQGTLWLHVWQAKDLWLHTLGRLCTCGRTVGSKVFVHGCTLLASNVPVATLMTGNAPVATRWQVKYLWLHNVGRQGKVPVATLLASKVPVATLWASKVPVATLLASNVPVATLLASKVPVATLLASKVPVATPLASKVLWPDCWQARYL
jgi:hypothetical protein